jgi:hypothetical protein
VHISLQAKPVPINVPRELISGPCSYARTDYRDAKSGLAGRSGKRQISAL